MTNFDIHDALRVGASKFAQDLRAACPSPAATVFIAGRGPIARDIVLHLYGDEVHAGVEVRKTESGKPYVLRTCNGVDGPFATALALDLARNLNAPRAS